MNIVWVELCEKRLNHSNEIHAAIEDKSYTFCNKNTMYMQECKFETIYDFNNAKRCRECEIKSNNLYKGVM